MGLTETPKASRRLGTFDSLQNRNFRLLWIGMVIGSSGMWMQMLAQGWLILDLTDSPFFLGLVGFMRAVPGVFFSLWGGVLADRMDRRKLMIVNAFLFMAFSFILTALVATNTVQIWHVLLLAFLGATVGSMDQPARQALVPALVGRERLMNAISLNSVAMHGPRIFAPSVAGAIIPLVGTAGCFFLQGLSYVGIIVTLFMMQIPPSLSIARQSSPWNNLVEGLSHARKDTTLLGLIILAGFTSMFGVQYPQFMPVFARDVLDSGPQGLGLLYTSSGIAALIASLALASLTAFKRKGLLLLVSLLVFSVGVIFFSLSTSLVTSMAILFVTGGTAGVFLALNNTLVQLASPDHLRGRIMGMFALTGAGMSPLGSLLTGSVASLAGAPLAIGLGAVILLITVVTASAFVPNIRKLE